MSNIVAFPLSRTSGFGSDHPPVPRTDGRCPRRDRNGLCPTDGGSGGAHVHFSYQSSFGSRSDTTCGFLTYREQAAQRKDLGETAKQTASFGET